MNFIYNGKPIIPTKTAMDELSEIDLDLYKVCKILENSFQIRKRKKNIVEKGIKKGNKIINAVVVDMSSYYKLIHVGMFSITKKHKKLMRC